MIGFTLNEEQEALRSTVAEFAREVVAPVIGGYYERGEFPYEIVARMGKLGLFGLPFPEEYGGMGGDYFAFCLALHELARVDSSVAITLEAGVALGAMPIFRFGSAEQRDRWLPELCQGERLAAFGLTEPGGGSDIAGGMRTRARADGDEWVIDGSKAFITNSGTSITSVVTVLAITGDVGSGGRGRRRQTAGRRSRRSWSRPGRRASRSGRSTPRSAGALRTPGSWPSAAAGCRGRICSASPAAATPSSCRPWTRAGSRSPRWRPGWRRAASTSACGTCGERTAFGHELGHYQAIQFKIADMAARAHVARLAWYDAAARLVAGEPFKSQAAIAKLTCSNAAMDNARDATQIFGGYGFMNEFPVARFYRDAKVLEIGEGTSEVQRMVHRPAARAGLSSLTGLTLGRGLRRSAVHDHRRHGRGAAQRDHVRSSTSGARRAPGSRCWWPSGSCRW